MFGYITKDEKLQWIPRDHFLLNASEHEKGKI